MKRADEISSTSEARIRQAAGGRNVSPAAAGAMEATPQAFAQHVLMDVIDRSPRVAAQRALDLNIQNSPRMIAQREQFDSLDETGRHDSVTRQEVLVPVDEESGLQEDAPAGEPGDTSALPLQDRFEPTQGKGPSTALPHGGSGLPAPLKSGIQTMSSVSMDTVKVHDNPSRSAQLHALAYARGSDIHVAPGKERHLPHEAWHVVQQAQGRVRPTLQMKSGVRVNDEASLEREADEMGARAMTHAAPPGSTQRRSNTALRWGAVRSQPVLQAFYLREGNQVGWIDDERRVNGALRRSEVDERRKFLKSKKAQKYTVKIVQVPETKRYLLSIYDVLKIKSHITVAWAGIDSVIDAVGADRARIIFASDEPVAGTHHGVQQIIRHATGLRSLNVAVFKTMMEQPRDSVLQLLANVEPERFLVYFQGSVPQQTELVKRHEFKSFGTLVSDESQLTRDRVLETDPTAAQGAHYHKEHGAHNTVHQTIRLAVEFALRGGMQATKGNWASNYLQERAIQWASTRLQLDLQRARAHTARDTSVLDVITPPGGQATSLFGDVRANARNAITQGPYHTGSVTGKRGNAHAVITGDFNTKQGILHAGALHGDFRGNVTGALVAGTNIVDQPATVTRLRGNGAVAAKLDGWTTAGPNRLGGDLHGEISYTGAQVNISTNADYFDGIGTMRSKMDGGIDANATNWVQRPASVGGYIDAASGARRIDDGAGNEVRLRSAEFTQGYWHSAIGKPVRKELDGYSNGWSRPVATGGQYRNVIVTISDTGAVAGGAFQPDTLQEIVNNADIAGKSNTYLKRGAGPGPASISGQLLSDTPQFRGTLMDLQNAGLVKQAVTSLASMRLTVMNVAKNNATANPDVDAVAQPIAGANYHLRVGGNLYDFNLAALNLASAGWTGTDFRVLFKLTSAARAAYEPFTAY